MAGYKREYEKYKTNGRTKSFGSSAQEKGYARRAKYGLFGGSRDIKQSPNYQNRSQFLLFLDTNTMDPTIHLTNNWNMTKILAKYLRYITNQPEKQMPLQCSMILIILCVNITKSARMNQIVKWLKYLMLYPIMKDSGDSFWPVIW